MLANLQIIGNDGVPHPFRPVLLLSLNGILIVGHHAFGDRIREETLLLLRIVDTCRGTDIQTFDRVDIDEHVSEQTPIGVSVVFVALQNRERILTLRETAGRRSLCQIAVGRIDRQQGVVLEHALDVTAGSAYLRSAVKREVLTDSHNIFQHLIVGVNTRRETVEVRSLDDTVVLVVTQREERATLLSAIADRDIVVLDYTGTGGLSEPVCVAYRHRSGCIKVLIKHDIIQNRLTLLIIAPVVMVTKYVRIRIRRTIVDIGLPHSATELLGIEDVHTVHVVLYGYRSIQRDT